MFQRILVPLDGSERAEQALPVAARMARASQGSVLLLRVLPPLTGLNWTMQLPPPSLEDQAAERRAITAYLERIAASESLTGVETATEVIEGQPASVILETAQTKPADLIVLCSHGRAGIKRWALGSVAQKVARHSPVPVLVLREGTNELTSEHPRIRAIRVMVALDGSPLAECAIPVAACIARSTGGSLLFVRVVVSPGDSAIDSHAASTYLEHRARRVEGSELSIQTCVFTGIPAQQILACIETQAIDLVVMSSRGETGLKRWAFGSVAQKVLRQSPSPVLILHESAGPLSNLHPTGRRPVRVLVALDGSSLAETTLAPAAALSAALSAPDKGSLHLVRVLPLPQPTSAAEAISGARQLDIADAQTSLQVAEDSFRGASIFRLPDQWWSIPMSRIH